MYDYVADDLPERPKQVFTVEEVSLKTTFPEIMDIGRFRSLDLLINTTARLIRLQRRFKDGEKEGDEELRVADVEEAVRVWIY